MNSKAKAAHVNFLRWTVAFIAMLLVGAAEAGMLDEMWEHPVELRRGVMMRAFATSTPRLMKAYVVTIDLSTPGIGFAATERAGRWGERMADVTNRVCLIETRRETTADFMLRRRALGECVEVAVNTAPWSPFPPPPGNDFADPRGWCIANGTVVSPPAGGEGVFIVRKDGSAEITAAPKPPVSAEGIAFVASGFGLIMTNGTKVVGGYYNPSNLHPRTAFGLTADRRTLVLLVVDGRQPGYSDGADKDDLCDIMSRYGVTDAINMDGGGSSSLVVFDRSRDCPVMLNRHRAGKIRANAVNFGITFDDAASLREVERAASVYHSYEFTKIEDTPPPEGYAPFYISHFGRHGSRRLSHSQEKDVLAILDAADRKGKLTKTGKELLARMRRLAAAHSEMTGMLSERGANEHRTLARRMSARFPSVFEGSRRIRCMSSTYPRVLASMQNFTTTLQSLHPGLSFDFSTGDKVLRLLNGTGFSEKRIKARLPYKDKITALVGKTSAADGLAQRIFSSADAAGEPGKFAQLLFSCAAICQCLNVELGGMDLFRFFSDDEIAALSRLTDMYMYGLMGDSEEFGGLNMEASRALGLDFVERADACIADDRVAADLRFGHDSGLWPLAALFELEGVGNRCKASDAANMCPGWKWMPMAANLQMVFYRNTSDEVLVKILYNEKETLVRGLAPRTGPYYAWKELKAKIEKSCR